MEVTVVEGKMKVWFMCNSVSGVNLSDAKS